MALLVQALLFVLISAGILLLIARLYCAQLLARRAPSGTWWLPVGLESQERAEAISLTMVPRETIAWVEGSPMPQPPTVPGPPSPPIRVLLVDNRGSEALALARGLAANPELHVVGLAGGADLAHMMGRECPDVLVLEHGTLEQLARDDPPTSPPTELMVSRAILLGSPTGAALRRVAMADAVGWTPLDSSPEEVAQAIRRTCAVQPLSARELEVLQVFAESQDTAAAAARLATSVQTIRAHLRNSMRKVGARSELDTAAIAARVGLVGHGRPDRTCSAERAEALLRDVLTENEYQRLCQDGYLEIPSPTRQGRTYRVPRHGGRVTVYEGGRPIMALCVGPSEPLPAGDVVLVHKLMIEGSEDEYLRIANATRLPIPVWQADPPPPETGSISPRRVGPAALGGDGSGNAARRVFTWGRNWYGELGAATETCGPACSTATPSGSCMSCRWKPRPVVALSGVVALAAGDFHNLTLRADGTVWAWGQGSYGVLGNGTDGQHLTPIRVSGLDEVVAIAAGEVHSLALKVDGTVWQWGNNILTPLRVGGLPAITAIAAGDHHSLALASDGSVWVWGRNAYGELGIGTANSDGTPVRVRRLDAVRAVAGGARHSLALRADGTVWAWGQGYFGQLGDGGTADRLVPVPVDMLAGATAIAAGNSHSLALHADGTVWGWGDNSCSVTDGTVSVYGGHPTRLLRCGSGGHALTPVRMPYLEAGLAIAAGHNFCLALQSDGTVRAWGLNLEGRLGVRTDDALAAPVQVSNLIGVTAIAAGNFHGLALGQIP